MPEEKVLSPSSVFRVKDHTVKFLGLGEDTTQTHCWIHIVTLKSDILYPSLFVPAWSYSISVQNRICI